MSQFNKIIVATDFSAPSIEALREADLIAHRTGAELIVFHAVPNLVRNNPLFPHQNIEDAYKLPKLMDQAAEAVDALVQQHLHPDRDNIHVAVDTGWADTTLMNKAEELGADLIVVGNRGYSGLRHVLLGSVAERVVRYAPCAVLVARTSPENGHVLAATDFSDPALPAVAAAATTAKRRNATLSVLHSLAVRPYALSAVSSPLGGGPVIPDDASLNEARAVAAGLIKESLGRLGAEGQPIVEDGLPEDDILRHAAKLPADLIVLGAWGRSAINRIALGSVAETVARSAPCSVLVVRSKEGSQSSG